MSLNSAIRSGKTKIVTPLPEDPTRAIIQSKDDITAFNAIKHDILPGKAEYATDTTCNVFRLLSACGIPVAFEKQLDASRFVAPFCDMIPYEVIVRREAHGSYLKRYPFLKKGHVFPKLALEFFLKTNNQEWQGHKLPKDDPFIQFQDNKMLLFKPDQNMLNQEPCLTLDQYPLQDKPELFEIIGTIAKRSFLILEKAWQLAGGRLVDFKIELGFDSAGKLLLADVIDNDSWRVVQSGNYIDKQFYRDGGDLDSVSNLYKRVRDLTSQFSIPKQRIIIWRGSEKDNVEPFVNYFKSFEACKSIELVTITCSMHKDPVKAMQTLNQIVQEISDSILIAYIGRSNGAGPRLAACCSIPAITVPAGFDKFPDDVWSSLRMPSEVPLMTILDPANAMLAALQILAMRNPQLYVVLREKLEQKAINFVQIPEYIIPMPSTNVAQV